MEVINFFFNDFWHFFGLIIVIAVGLDGIADIVKAFRKPQNTKENDNN